MSESTDSGNQSTGPAPLPDVGDLVRSMLRDFDREHYPWMDETMAVTLASYVAAELDRLGYVVIPAPEYFVALCTIPGQPNSMRRVDH